MGEVMNVKKWSWPGVLTFGKTGSSRHKPLSGLGAHPSGSQNSSEQSYGDTSATVAKEDKPRNNPNSVQTNEDNVQGGVDQSALDDAISSPAPREVAAVVEMNSKTNREAFHDEPQANVHAFDANSFPDNAASNALRDADVLPLLTTISQPPGPSFSTLSVFLSEPSKPLVVRRRQVLHMSVRPKTVLP